MLRIPALFLCHLVLWTLITAFNHTLGAWQITFFGGGLFVTYAGLELEPREGLTACILAGFIFDAWSPVPFGQQALVFGLAYCMLHLWKQRLMWDELKVQSAVAATTNAAMYVVLAVIHFWGMAQWRFLVTRSLWELGLSTAVVVLVAPWAFALQDQTLELATPPKFRRHGTDER